MDETDAVTALDALAQPSRLAVFRLLVQAGPQGLAAGEIADKIGVPANTLSFHLGQLDHAGLVRSHRNGRSIIYAAGYARMQELLDFLMENCCQGSACAPPAMAGKRARAGAKKRMGAKT
jgi:ArsR family transcriptional regulator, arsenate/arsenite/antimonite-responsive transcriptional repressor